MSVMQGLSRRHGGGVTTTTLTLSTPGGQIQEVTSDVRAATAPFTGRIRVLHGHDKIILHQQEYREEEEEAEELGAGGDDGVWVEPRLTDGVLQSVHHIVCPSFLFIYIQPYM